MSLRTSVSTVGANQFPSRYRSPSGRPPPRASFAPWSWARATIPATFSHSAADTFGPISALSSDGSATRMAAERSTSRATNSS